MESVKNRQKNAKPSILIVEDHDALRDFLNTWLGTVFKNSNILQVKNGEEALDQVLIQPPDIVLMDVTLPRMNGIEAARRIKDAVPEAHVVMLSICEDHAYKADAAAAGVSAYIPKQKMGTELIPVIARLMTDKVNTV